MGYRLNRLDEPVFMAVPKPLLIEFGIHLRLESCGCIISQIALSRDDFKNQPGINDFYIKYHPSFLSKIYISSNMGGNEKSITRNS